MAKKHDAGKIFVKIMATLLAGLILLATISTLLFYLLH